MTDPTTPSDSAVELDRRASSGLAPWQKMAGIIGLVVILGLAILMFGPGSGGHGPSRHAPASTSVPTEVVTQP